MSTIKTTTLSTQGGSTVPVDTVVNGTAKAWVNFDGTGTVAIRRAFNVSSITDRGTGAYRINFTTSMPDANYSIVCQAQQNSVNNQFTRIGELASGYADIADLGTTGTFYDVAVATAVIFS